MILIGEHGKTREFKLRHFRFSASAREVTDLLCPIELDLFEKFMIVAYGEGFTAIQINQLFETKKIIEDYEKYVEIEKDMPLWHRTRELRKERYIVEEFVHLNG